MANDPKISRSRSAEAHTAAHRPISVWVVTCIVAALFVTAFVLARRDPWGERVQSLPDGFQLDLQSQWDVDPQRIAYREVQRIPLSLRRARAISAGPDDTLVVVGDQEVQVHDARGALKWRATLGASPTCLGVGGPEHFEPGRVYAGTQAAVEIISAEGKPLGSWPLPHPEARLTAIAIGASDIFLADAHRRVVYRCDTEGALVQVIGATAADDPAASPFVVPDQFFDVVVASDDLLYIANPGKLRVAAYSFGGDPGPAWGRAGSTLEAFFGCCNPAHLAVRPDGGVVTSEHGVPRVKVYQPSGQFDSVVAGPRQLDVPALAASDPRSGHRELSFDITVDQQGRVLVLDPRDQEVIVFAPRTTRSGDGS